MRYTKYLFAILLFSACNKFNNEKPEPMAVAMSDGFAVSNNGEPAGNVVSPAQKQIILKTAKIDIRTESFTESIHKLERLVSKFEALVQDQKENNDTYNKSGIFTLRVPADKLEMFIDSLKLLGVECTQYEVKSEDATAEYVDTEIRLKTKHNIYEQYMALLKQAKNVEEVLKVQESARVLQEEMESMEGRIKFLDSHARYSTINLNLYEYQNKVTKADGFWFKAKRQFIMGYELIQNFALFIVTLWPLVILTLIIIFARRKIKRFFAGRWNPKTSV